MTLKQHLSGVIMCNVMFFSALGKPFVILIGSGCQKLLWGRLLLIFMSQPITMKDCHDTLFFHEPSCIFMKHGFAIVAFVMNRQTAHWDLLRPKPAKQKLEIKLVLRTARPSLSSLACLWVMNTSKILRFAFWFSFDALQYVNFKINRFLQISQLKTL